MLNFALLALILLAMIIPVAIIGALGLALKGVSSLDLSILDFYIVIATTHALAALVIAQIAVVAAAAYLIAYKQIRWLAA